MYLSEVRLVNWRSYQDETFRFPEPTGRKPLVLVGAMNGHGKTSFLLGLYFGIFGRYGIRYAEGFELGDETRVLHYPQALRELRRQGADYDDPTEIDITFSPTGSDPADATEFRIQRRWFFTSTGQPRANGGEEVHVFVGGTPRALDELDDAIDHVQAQLFPAHVLPAFFFDGEQAQRRIKESGDSQIREAVEVLYGTKLLVELNETLQSYARRCRDQNPELQSSTKSEVDALRCERDAIEARLEAVESETRSFHEQKQRETERFDTAYRRLEVLGLSGEKRLERLTQRLSESLREMEGGDAELRGVAVEIALPLALQRLFPAILRRLDSEQVREEWEALRAGTESRIDKVIAAALPQPDPLLDPLGPKFKEQMALRLRDAIRSIYNPPPAGCAADFRFGHVRGKARAGVAKQLDEIVTLGSQRVEQVAIAARQARENYETARRKHARLRDLPAETGDIQRTIGETQDALAQLNQKLGRLLAEEASLREDLKQKKAEIGRIETDLQRLAPAQRRLEVVDRVRDVLSELSARLAPLAMTRLEKAITGHFRKMADPRFENCKIEFRPAGEPVLVNGKDETPIRTMSGFERRTFGIAFSLALADVSGFRAPLVIDTPLGNADSDYRTKMLQHIVEAKLDQIIILTHDEEVVGPYLDAVRDKVGKQFLVQFERTSDEAGESFVYPDRYFGGGRP